MTNMGNVGQEVLSEKERIGIDKLKRLINQLCRFEEMVRIATNAIDDSVSKSERNPTLFANRDRIGDDCSVIKYRVDRGEWNVLHRIVPKEVCDQMEVCLTFGCVNITANYNENHDIVVGIDYKNNYPCNIRRSHNNAKETWLHVFEIVVPEQSDNVADELWIDPKIILLIMTITMNHNVEVYQRFRSSFSKEHRSELACIELEQVPIDFARWFDTTNMRPDYEFVIFQQTYYGLEITSTLSVRYSKLRGNVYCIKTESLTSDISENTLVKELFIKNIVRKHEIITPMNSSLTGFDTDRASTKDKIHMDVYSGIDSFHCSIFDDDFWDDVKITDRDNFERRVGLKK